MPLLKHAKGPGCYALSGEGLVVEWQLGTKVLQLLANLSGEEVDLPDHSEASQELALVGSVGNGVAGPWSVKWSLRHA